MVDTNNLALAVNAVGEAAKWHKAHCHNDPECTVSLLGLHIAVDILIGLAPESRRVELEQMVEEMPLF